MIELLRSRKMVGATVALIALGIVIIILESLFAVDDTKPSPHPDANGESIHDRLNKPEASGKEASKSGNPAMKNVSDQLSENALKERFGCWEVEQFDVKKPCARCSNFELKSRHLSACLATGYKEEVYCHKSGLTLKSCDMSSSHFWAFEIWMTICSALFCYLTHMRESQIQSRMVAKINKQIASGV